MDFLNSIYHWGAFAFFVQCFVSLFVVVNPIGNVPIFVTLLERFPEEERTLTVRKASFTGAVALLLVTISGNAFFRLLDISLDAFRIAGGILLTIVAIEMLHGKRTRTQTGVEDEEHYREKEDLSIVPLGIPILAGPGAFTTGIVFFDAAGSNVNRVILVFSILLVFLISYLVLVRSNVVLKYVGKTVTKVAVRIMGLMLLSLAMQFILTGIISAFQLK